MFKNIKNKKWKFQLQTQCKQLQTEKLFLLKINIKIYILGKKNFCFQCYVFFIFQRRNSRRREEEEKKGGERRTVKESGIAGQEEAAEQEARVAVYAMNKA